MACIYSFWLLPLSHFSRLLGFALSSKPVWVQTAVGNQIHISMAYKQAFCKNQSIL